MNADVGHAGAEPASEIKILYIVGWKRSGSTILGNVLGELDGFFHAGELRTVWGKGLKGGRLCGCGVPVAQCPLWSEVLTAVFSDPLAAGAGPDEIYRWQAEAVRMRHMGRLLAADPALPTRWEALDCYRRVLAALYRALAQVTGARVLVDSSKQHADAALVGLLPGFAPYFVHLVRDPRAVAFSWRRRKASPGEGRRQEMSRYSPARSTRSWAMVNLAAEAVRRRHGPERSILVRYEDFVTQPRTTIEKILALMAEQPRSLPIEGTTVYLSTNHTAGGNPDRLSSGAVDLREDDEWLTHQGRLDRTVSTALALPLLRRYGYALRPRPGQVRELAPGRASS